MFPFRHTSGKVVLIADVDDMSVGIAVLQLSHSGPARALACERRMLPIEERNESQALAGITQLFDQTLESLIKKYLTLDAKKPSVPIDEGYAIVRAPWTHFRSAEAEEKFEKPRTITQDMISALAKKALDASAAANRTTILEAGVMRVALNGYATSKPLSKHAEQLAVVAFESDLNPELRRALDTAFGKHVAGRKLVIKSGATALLTVLHELFPNVHRSVILEIGASSSRIAIMRKDSVMQTVQVPEGMATILKRVSNATLPEEIMTQLRMLTAETCSTDACKALKDTMARAEPEITKVFGEAFASLAAARRFPNTAILCAPHELTPWLEGFFSRIDFAQFTATMQPLEVESLSGEFLSRMVIFQPGAPTDIGLSIAGGYVNILEQ